MEYIIYASLIIITLICLWAIISIPKNYLFKSILIPVMILVSVSTWYTYNAILGYGTEFRTTKEVMYHSHVADKPGGKIYILLTAFGEKEPRLHIYPWTEELEEQLKGADQQQGQGVFVVGKLQKKEERFGANLRENDEKWVWYDMPPDEYMPKD